MLARLGGALDAYDAMAGAKAAEPEPAFGPSPLTAELPLVGRKSKAKALGSAEYTTDAGFRGAVEKRLAQARTPIDLDAPSVGGLSAVGSKSSHPLRATPMRLRRTGGFGFAPIEEPGYGYRGDDIPIMEPPVHPSNEEAAPLDHDALRARARAAGKLAVFNTLGPYTVEFIDAPPILISDRFDPAGRAYHSYDQIEALHIGPYTDEDVALAWEALLTHPVNGAVGPISEDDISEVRDPYTDAYVGLVNHEIYEQALTVINRTLPGHLFDDGEVQRTLILTDRGIDIYILEIGNNNDWLAILDDLNEPLAPPVWRIENENVRSYFKRRRRQ